MTTNIFIFWTRIKVLAVFWKASKSYRLKICLNPGLIPQALQLIPQANLIHNFKPVIVSPFPFKATLNKHKRKVKTLCLSYAGEQLFEIVHNYLRSNAFGSIILRIMGTFLSPFFSTSWRWW